MKNNFKKDMDILVKEKVKEIIPIFQEYGIYEAHVEVNADKLDEILKKYFTKEEYDNINVTLNINAIQNSCEVYFYYKKRRIESQGHYILPKNYKPVSTLEILKECIKQDTNTPDIKSLEMGEN